MTVPGYISPQPFDSDILRAVVWRLEEADEVERAVALAREAGVALMTIRTETKQAEGLEQFGFKPVETLVNYEGLMPIGESGRVRQSAQDDVPAIEALAAKAFSTTRWHLDPLIDNRYANQFKARWARNNALGRASLSLVAEVEDNVAGFNQVLVRNDLAIIDLIAVGAEGRRTGLGRELVYATAQTRCPRLRVGTQLNNTASRALYESLGLQECHRQTTWHWHADQ